MSSALRNSSKSRYQNMAEDTRLAEASLLLNYSEQSYKEQRNSLSHRSLKKEQSESDASESISPNQSSSSEDVKPRICSISPPQSSSPLLIQDREIQYSPYQATFSMSPPGMLDQTVESNDQQQHPDDNITAESLRTENRLSDEPTTTKISNNWPINDLLAAVNCAMPNIRSRPNILQRASRNPDLSAKSVPLNSSSLSPPDHNYCQPILSEVTDSNADKFYCLRHDDDITNSGPLCELETTRQRQEHATNSDNPEKTFPSPERPSKRLKLVAIHLGAGNSRDGEASKSLAKRICEEVMLGNLPIKTTTKRRRKIVCIVDGCELDCVGGGGEDNCQISAESAVVRLIKRMENNSHLNCGYGSNLNIKGQVECDASLMCDSHGAWAGVGSLSGCKNPIILAKALYDHRSVQRPLGLIQPNLLVGSGAKLWMREHCPHLTVNDSQLITSSALSIYQKFKSHYDAAEAGLGLKTAARPAGLGSLRRVASKNQQLDMLPPLDAKSVKCHKESEETQIHSPVDLDHGFYCITTGDNLRRNSLFSQVVSCENESKTPRFKASNCISEKECVQQADATIECNKIEEMIGDLDCHEAKLDTVGAVAIDYDNNFACAISSGGLLLKYKGRVGQAAIPGAGCWAEDSIAVTTTGVGEYLTVNLFAKKFYDKMQTLRLLYDLGHVERRPDLSNLISGVVEDCFEDMLQSPALNHVAPIERQAGMLAVCKLNSKCHDQASPKRIDNQSDFYLSFAHNTKSMCVGYMTCNDTIGHSMMTINEDKDSLGSAQVTTMRFSIT